MANPRQRRKARSSSHRPVSHSRRAKSKLKKTPPIRGPKALQDAWDKHKTVRQNYAKLGLVLSLDPSQQGGIEVSASQRIEESPVAEGSSSQSTNVSPAELGRIVRDEDGNVVGFEALASSEQPPIPAREGLPEPDINNSILHRWTVDLATSNPSQIDAKGESLINELERISVPATGTTTLAIPISGVGSRHGSEGEQRYLQRLVSKYGTDVEGMARDRRLNPEQRTVGQLRRALKKHGFEG